MISPPYPSAKIKMIFHILNPVPFFSCLTGRMLFARNQSPVGFPRKLSLNARAILLQRTVLIKYVETPIAYFLSSSYLIQS